MFVNCLFIIAKKSLLLDSFLSVLRKNFLENPYLIILDGAALSLILKVNTRLISLKSSLSLGILFLGGILCPNLLEEPCLIIIDRTMPSFSSYLFFLIFAYWDYLTKILYGWFKLFFLKESMGSQNSLDNFR